MGMQRVYVRWTSRKEGDGVATDKHVLDVRVGSKDSIFLSEAEAGALVNELLKRLDDDLNHRKYKK